ncbi:class I SAM-dependent methyltransferase [Alkalicoccus urumqiensis]|uniref:class I SAM-dependent methyltransferase n=1 Tax=Alkalicoccus urumqiensis TaxID=1548213 RepID=UPI0015E5B6DC|nr:class I SAM-dependent methyltransferase [Alkalicoccus urumqiensis]
MTTGAKNGVYSGNAARAFAEAHNWKFVPREKRPVHALLNEWHCPVIVYGRERIEIHKPETAPFFYHPNGAVLKYYDWKQKKTSPLLRAIEAEPGGRLIDATMGLGADSLFLQAAVPDFTITAVEASPLLSAVVQEGFLQFPMPEDELAAAAAKISIVNEEHTTYLKKQGTDSVEYVYFDPMFDQADKTSKGIAPLRSYAAYGRLSVEAFEQAVRTASKRVVVKADPENELFRQFPFKKISAGNAHCYGYYDC